MGVFGRASRSGKIQFLPFPEHPGGQPGLDQRAGAGSGLGFPTIDGLEDLQKTVTILELTGGPQTSGLVKLAEVLAVLSSNGVHLVGNPGNQQSPNPQRHQIFTFEPGDNYRIISGDTAADELIMSHVSTNFDRSGFQQDWNIVFPLDRLRELCDEGHIGSVARFHYSFMGAMGPTDLEQSARKVAGLLKDDKVDGALLVPV